MITSSTDTALADRLDTYAGNCVADHMIVEAADLRKAAAAIRRLTTPGLEVTDEQLAEWVQHLDWDIGLTTAQEIRQLRDLLCRIMPTTLHATPGGDIRAALEAALPYLDNSDSPGGCNGKHKNCDHCAAIAKVRAALAPAVKP